MNYELRKTNKGFSLLEVVIASGLISVSLFSLMSVLSISFKLMEESTRNIQAAFMLEEGVEAIKIMRDSSWENNIENLQTETNYYLSLSNHDWQATSSNIYIENIFERSFSIQNTYRDGNDDITESGGLLDENTKKITVSVSWFNGKSTTTKYMPFYLTNFLNN